MDFRATLKTVQRWKLKDKAAGHINNNLDVFTAVMHAKAVVSESQEM